MLDDIALNAFKVHINCISNFKNASEEIKARVASYPLELSRSELHHIKITASSMNLCSYFPAKLEN